MNIALGVITVTGKGISTSWPCCLRRRQVDTDLKCQQWWTDCYIFHYFRHHRAIKKNNFFPTGTRIDENPTDLCVENSHKQPSKTITLQLHTSHGDKQKAANTLTVNHSNIKPKTSKSPREKLYRSVTQISPTRPLFHSVNSYLNFNNFSKSKSAGLYSSEQYLDSNRLDSILQPLENLKRPVTKKLVAKYSDMEIQKELNDFFKIRPVK